MSIRDRSLLTTLKTYNAFISAPGLARAILSKFLDHDTVKQLTLLAAQFNRANSIEPILTTQLKNLKCIYLSP